MTTILDTAASITRDEDGLLIHEFPDSQPPTIPRRSEKREYGICISGGGIQGLSLLSSTNYYARRLYRRGHGFDDVNYFFGCSIGSIIGFMMSQNMNIYQVGMAISTMCSTLACVRYQLEELNPRLKTLRFRDLGKNGRAWFGCVAVPVEHRDQLKIFSPETTPDVLVMDAVTASASMRGVFPPVNIDGVLYEDGGTVKIYPLLEFMRSIPDNVSVLGVTLYVDNPKAPDWLRRDIAEDEMEVHYKYRHQHAQREVFSVHVPVIGTYTTTAPPGVMYCMLSMTRYWCEWYKLV
jgi:predicted acylesterase/phospholipase RssA